MLQFVDRRLNVDERDPSLPQRIDFLHAYGLKLLPHDAGLWASAAASLVDQRDFKRALQAADKALSLDPKNADAQKARASAEQQGKAEK